MMMVGTAFCINPPRAWSVCSIQVLCKETGATETALPTASESVKLSQHGGGGQTRESHASQYVDALCNSGAPQIVIDGRQRAALADGKFEVSGIVGC